MKLSSQTLEVLPPTVARPTYDRSEVAAGIVHFGVGGFHRAHEAMYIDRLLNAGGSKEWGICGVGLMPSDGRMRDVLNEQDGLYTLVLKHPNGARERRIIGSIVEYLYAPDGVEAVLEKLADPVVRVVSLTITEGGYNFHPNTGKFDDKNPSIVTDLAPGSNPSTVFGLVAEGLARRRERGITPFTVMSCDNIQGNGDMARATFTAFAALRDSEFGDWMRREVRFPNTMVDRITPVTSADDVAENTAALGVEDAWPVVCEPFEQWVVQDDFGLGRPDWDNVGAQFVADVEPYELMKLRLLNSSHQAMAYFGYLSGHRYAHEAMNDYRILDLVRRYMDEEGTPTLLPVPGIDLEEYKRTLIERFSNAEVKDTLARLCLESSDRIPKWLVPVIHDQLAAGRSVRLSAAIVASWARYAEGTDEQGKPIEIVDNLRDVVKAAAKAQAHDPLAFVRNDTFFGDLAECELFVQPYRWALASLHSAGARATLDALSAQ